MPINAGNLSEFKEDELIPLEVITHNGCNIRDFPITKHRHYVACAVTNYRNETSVHICENVPDMYVFSRAHFVGSILELKWFQISKENLAKHNIETSDQFEKFSDRFKKDPTKSQFYYYYNNFFISDKKEITTNESKSSSILQSCFRAWCKKR